MPRPAINDYTFYKIVNINCDVDLCYVGSSCNMKLRRIAHKNVCNNVSNPRHNLKVYRTIREHGGWEEFKIVELGYREQLTLTQAHMVEEEYRIGEKANLNTLKCFETEEECKERNKIQASNWYQNNKEWIKTKQSVIIVCDCGCEITKSHISRHIKSQKHIKLMNAKTD